MKPDWRDGEVVSFAAPRWPDDMPDGCFWAKREDIEAILAQGDSFAVGGVAGFEWRDIDNHNWQMNIPTIAEDRR